MNKRIKELALQAGGSHYPTVGGKTLEKFAELIVRECITALRTDECNYSDLAVEEFTRNRKRNRKHFGVEE